MRGSKAKAVRREARAKTREFLRLHSRVRPRWWMRVYLAVLPLLRAVGYRPSEETARRIARRGMVAEIVS